MIKSFSIYYVSKPFFKSPIKCFSWLTETRLNEFVNIFWVGMRSSGHFFWRCGIKMGVCGCRISLQCSDTASGSFLHSGHREWNRERGGRKSQTQPRRAKKGGTGGNKMSQTGTQGFLRLDETQSVSLNVSWDAKAFTESRMHSLLVHQWQLCHLLVFLNLFRLQVHWEKRFLRWSATDMLFFFR